MLFWWAVFKLFCDEKRGGGSLGGVSKVGVGKKGNLIRRKGQNRDLLTGKWGGPFNIMGTVTVVLLLNHRTKQR